MIAAEHSTISQRHVAPLVRCPRTARVVARFEILGVVNYEYPRTPPRPIPPKPAPRVVETAPVPKPIARRKPLRCRCCRTPFVPTSSNNPDCNACMAGIPVRLRKGPKVAAWSSRESYLVQQTRAAMERHRARLDRQYAKRVERVSALRASRAGGGE